MLESELRTVCALVARGCTLKEAARYVGCKLSEIRHEREASASFRQQLVKARIKANLAPLRAMQRAMLKDWRAAAWYLERTHPEKFGRRNHRAFTQKQASLLIKDLANIISEEVSSPVVSERVCARIEAAVRYTTHAHNDTKRTGPELRQAMRHYDRKSRSVRPTPAEAPPVVPRASSTPSPPSKTTPAPSATKPQSPYRNPPTTPQQTNNRPTLQIHEVFDYEGPLPDFDFATPEPPSSSSTTGGTDCRPNVIDKSTSATRPIVGAAKP